MKATFYFLFLSFFNPCHSQKVEINSPNPVAEAVYNYITVIESQFKKDGNKVFDLSSKVEMLNNLSGRSAKFIDGNYLGAIYEVSENDINFWKNWFYKNLDSFSYYNDDDINFKLLKELHILKIEYGTGLFRYSASEHELEKYRKISADVKVKKD
ncbi:hypothetical protein ACLI09_15075 [Flavobacterium sp. RHBU_24]|uniref:hypothetical protein n=1 Tax=Flavobacterium sp. RHBU_24 TaxID=3391185 RepID=UPI003984A856